MTEEGKKFDQGKYRMDLVPASSIIALAQVLEYGADKYGERNYMEGIKLSRYYAATFRHLVAWWTGEEFDKESERHHLKHAQCHCSLGPSPCIDTAVQAKSQMSHRCGKYQELV